MANEAFVDIFQDSFSFRQKGGTDRTFPRTMVSFPVRFSVVSEFEFEALLPIYSSVPSWERPEKPLPGEKPAEKEVPGTMASAILERLDNIERKLDQLLGVGGMYEDGGNSPVAEVGYARDLSGAGIRMDARIKMAAGWGLNVAVNTVDPYPLNITALCRVVRVIPQGDELIYETACSFVGIHEKDQADVNSFVVKRQRDLARNRQTDL